MAGFLFSLLLQEGKVELTTGEANGIREATARLFSKHGAKVVIADMQDDLGQSVCRDLNPSSTTFIHYDMTNEKDIENAVNTTTTKYGKLDIMFNNAGIADMAKPNILENDKAEFEKVQGVNLVGVFLGIKHAARVMLAARKGTIINMASVASIVVGGVTHAYTSSKHGVVGLTKNTTVELGQYMIRVNCVSSYLVATRLAKDLFKLNDEGLGGVFSNLNGAVLKMEDVADAVLYMGSDKLKYVSGHNLVVDGGYSNVDSNKFWNVSSPSAWDSNCIACSR